MTSINLLPKFRISYLLAIVFVALLSACGSSDKSTEVYESPALTPENTAVPVLAETIIVDSVRGDLTGDGVSELVAIYTTEQKAPDDDHEYSNQPARNLVIYKFTDTGWQKWKESDEVVLRADEGGVLGDPFRKMTIDTRVLSILHNGGSREKWDITDKYRLEGDDLRLIGYTNVSGTPCEYWYTADINLLTNSAIFEKAVESCKDAQPERTERDEFKVEEMYITLKDRRAEEYFVKSAKLDYEVVL